MNDPMREKFEAWHNDFYGPQDQYNQIRSLRHFDEEIGLGYVDPVVRAQFCAFKGGQDTTAHQAQMIEHLRGGLTPGYTAADMTTAAAQGFRDGAASHWQAMDTCPKHKGVLFYREDAGVFSGQLTYCETFMSEKEVEESDYDEQTLYAEDAFSFGPDGAYRCDGDLVPTHWMPFPLDPEVKP